MLKSIHTVLAGLWESEWPSVNRALLEANIKHELWSLLRHTVRLAQLALLARAHSQLSLATAQHVLGATDDVGALLLTAGWTEKQGFFAPPHFAENASSEATQISQLAQLTNYIVFLERKA